MRFCIGFLQWKFVQMSLHCHDYHTGLVPFMVEYCQDFDFFKGVKTVGTIHNGEYQGTMDWQMSNYMPRFDAWKMGIARLERKN